MSKDDFSKEWAAIKQNSKESKAFKNDTSLNVIMARLGALSSIRGVLSEFERESDRNMIYDILAILSNTP